MDSGVIWIISSFFIMFDLVFSSEFGFNVLLNIIKFVFVIKIKICIFKIFFIYNLINWDIEKFLCERFFYNINDYFKYEYLIYIFIEFIIYYKVGFLFFNVCEFFLIF